MNKLKTYISGILAGLCIALGGMVFLSAENKIIGALFFTVGLFTVCTLGFNLFTGKVCYVFENDISYAANLGVIWLGNLTGTWIAAKLISLTRIAPALSEKAQALCQIKLDDGVLSIFILAIFCNIMIYIGVEGFIGNPHETGKYLSLFFSITVFILCGFEHCVANMFYFSIARVWSLKAALYVLLMTAGNAVGGFAIPVTRRFIKERCD